MPGPAAFWEYTTVDASPADASETVVATLAGITTTYSTQIVHLSGYARVTPQAATTLVTVRIRRSALTGTLIATGTFEGPATVTGLAVAGTFLAAGDTPGDVGGLSYVMTVQCTTAGGASTVNTLDLLARAS